MISDLEIIRTALFAGQISAAKVDAQRALVRLDISHRELRLRDWSVLVLGAWAAQRDTYWFTVDDDITTYVRYPNCPGLGLGSGIGNHAARISAAERAWRELPAETHVRIGAKP